MTYYGRLNSIESMCNKTVVSESYLPTKNDWDTDSNNWAGTVKYSSSHKTVNSIYTISTTVLAKKDTYGNTPQLTKTVYRKYSAKFKNGKNYYQYFKEKTSYTLEGYLTTLDTTQITASVALDKNVIYCKGAQPNGTSADKIIPAPVSVSIGLEDVDTEKVNGKVQVKSLTRGADGHVVRNRLKANITTLSLSWSYLDNAEAKKLLEKVTEGQYVRVNYYDPVTGENVSKVMYNASRSLEAAVLGRFKTVSLDLVEA